MRRTVLIASVLLVVAPAGAATIPSGLRGVVMRGPTRPVCELEQPCTEPAKNMLLLFTRDGRDVGRTRTDAAGRYRIALPAGVYRVGRNLTVGIGHGLTPRTARVWPGRYVRLDFSIDTGIR
jgi:hypothetical protein